MSRWSKSPQRRRGIIRKPHLGLRGIRLQGQIDFPGQERVVLGEVVRRAEHAVQIIAVRKIRNAIAVRVMGVRFLQ